MKNKLKFFGRLAKGRPDHSEDEKLPANGT